MKDGRECFYLWRGIMVACCFLAWHLRHDRTDGINGFFEVREQTISEGLLGIYTLFVFCPLHISPLIKLAGAG